MYLKLRARKLSAVAVAAALTLLGVMQVGMPLAHADYVSGATIRLVDADGNAATNMVPGNEAPGFTLPAGLAAQLTQNDGSAITQPKVGTVLVADPGTWTGVSYFTYAWTYGGANGGTNFTTAIPTNGACASGNTGGNARVDQNGNSLAVAQNFAIPLCLIGDYMQVVITGHDATGAQVGTPQAVDTRSMGKIVGLNPIVTATWNNTNYGPTSANPAQTLTPYETVAWFTGYGYPDNTPPSGGIDSTNSGTAFPKTGTQTVNSGIHTTAGGDGTYAHPITFATDGVFEVPYGTEIFVPRFGRYFIAEDQCYECQGDYQGTAPTASNGGIPSATNLTGDSLTTAGGDGGPGLIHFDLWVGGSATDDIWQDVVQCENQLTLANDDGSVFMEPIIVNPPDNLIGTTVPGPIWDSTDKTCNGEPLDNSMPGNVGQFKNVAGGGTTTPHWTTTAGPMFSQPYVPFDSSQVTTGAHGTYNKANTWGNGVDSPADTTTGFAILPSKGSISPGTNLCMTDDGNSTAIGTPVTMEECADPTDQDPANLERLSSQMFTLTGSAIMINNLCLDMGYAPTGFPPPGEWSAPTDVTMAGNSQDDQYFTQNAAPHAFGSGTTAFNTQGSMPRPVTLQRCNFNANQAWEGTTNFVDMQMGYWSLADLGPIGSFPDKNNPGEMIDYLYAVNINGTYGDYSSDFWSTPMSRQVDDRNAVTVDTTKVGVADLANTTIVVSGGGLSTQSAEVYLFKAGVNLATVDPATDAIYDFGMISVDGGQVNLDGTYATSVTLPDNLKAGKYQIGVFGNYGDQPAPVSTSDGLSTSAIKAWQLGYVGMSGSGYNPPTVQGTGNFRDQNASVPTIGLSGNITVVSGTNANADTGGTPVGSMTPWIVLSGLICVGGVLLLQRRSAIMAGTRK